MDFQKIKYTTTLVRHYVILIILLLPVKVPATDVLSNDKVNLALRRTADRLLRLAGDSTSQIPSIKQLSNSVWQIRLEQTFNYDSLPSLLQASLDLHQINAAYDVTVKKCEDGTIDLGYNYLDFSTGAGVACGGRKRTDGCHYIEVSFTEDIKKNKLSGFGGWWILLAGGSFLAIWIYGRNKKPNIETPPAEDEKQNEEELKESLGWLEFGNSKLDVANQVLICHDSKQSLTFREAKLLSLFANNVNKVLEREYIIQQVWADEGVLVGRSVDVFVSRLRKKIADDQSLGLSVVHGVGYRLESNKVA